MIRFFQVLSGGTPAARACKGERAMKPRMLGWSLAPFWLLLTAGWTSAQISPTDMRSGVMSELGDVERTFYTVPAGNTFVLTDIFWSTNVLFDTDQATALHIRGNGNFRFDMRGAVRRQFNTSYQTLPIQAHFSTGLVFDAGSVLTARPLGQPASVVWILVWSGYLVSSTSSVTEPSPPASTCALGQNVPNPFNPTTEIRYILASPGKTGLKIYDSGGRLVRTLIETHQESGPHVAVWDGRNDIGQPMASGVYYYELSTDRAREKRKAVLLK